MLGINAARNLIDSGAARFLVASFDSATKTVAPLRTLLEMTIAK